MEASIRNGIRNVALDGAELDQRTLLLLSVVNAAKLADGLFASEERSSAKQRIKQLVEDERFGKAVNGAISDAIAIIVASTTAATIAAASH